MQKKLMKFNMYRLFDRLGEGVMFEYRIKYDWDSILKDGFNATNFVIEPIGIDVPDRLFLKKYRINPDDWNNDAVAYIKKDENEYAINTFCEELPDELYNELSAARNW
jgi:hypothetical protein